MRGRGGSEVISNWTSNEFSSCSFLFPLFLPPLSFSFLFHPQFLTSRSLPLPSSLFGPLFSLSLSISLSRKKKKNLPLSISVREKKQQEGRGGNCFYPGTGNLSICGFSVPMQEFKEDIPKMTLPVVLPIGDLRTMD